MVLTYIPSSATWHKKQEYTVKLSPNIVQNQVCENWVGWAHRRGFISRSWFGMQELVRHTISFNSRQSTDKQVDVPGVSTISFTGSFPQILCLLQRFTLPIQPSFRANVVWYVSYQSLSRSWYTDLDYGSYRLPELGSGLTAGVTGRQGKFTPPRHLIPPLVYPEVRVCPILKFAFPTGLMRSMTVRYLC
jgi:hypothetical protein